MNPVGSLNLATYDEGVAAISGSHLALDWLSIAYSSAAHNSAPSPFPPSQQHPSMAVQPIAPQNTPLTRKQADAALVRSVRPYSAKEVLVPCFRIASHFILGRVLGKLFVPSELGLSHLVSEPCADARFVLDMRHGSIVELRRYASSKTLLCVAYSKRRTEFVTLPPVHYSRVEISYQPDNTGVMAISALPSTLPGSFISVASASALPDTSSVSAQSPSQFLSLFEYQQLQHQQSQQQQPQIEHPPEAVIQSSWRNFCLNYASMFPTGALSATVTREPGPVNAAVKKETILVSLNDPYAQTFSCVSSPSGTALFRRQTPRRLLPRPTQ
ncbi:unnamed protein product [Agarophyton chilense]|eukprot:gb/GEZJ01002153.1/.p1 GENE.gb/GEZJ01002153.1/~~gb/GEZJ01002153.1/.p1  ORF type:complete len:328 (-),score=30.17 gb/GEZJ01002153.1/:490-1473(-)